MFSADTKTSFMDKSAGFSRNGTPNNVGSLSNLSSTMKPLLVLLYIPHFIHMFCCYISIVADISGCAYRIILLLQHKQSRRTEKLSATALPFYLLFSSYFPITTLSRCQISSTYCWMVLSEVNLPEQAVLRSAILAHLSSSL